MSGNDDTPHPTLQVVTGDPEPAELAALIAVVAAHRAHTDPDPVARSLWAAKSRLVRPPLRPGPGAWRASALPR